MGLFAFILFGLVAGLIARVLMPGKKHGMGLAPTALFCLAGTFVGGLGGSLIYGDHLLEIHSAGVILGILAVFLVLFLMGVGARGRRRKTLF